MADRISWLSRQALRFRQNENPRSRMPNEPQVWTSRLGILTIAGWKAVRSGAGTRQTSS